MHELILTDELKNEVDGPVTIVSCMLCFEYWVDLTMYQL